MVIIEGKGAVLATFGVNLRHLIVTNGDLLRRCVEVRIVIELSFGVVSGVCQGIHVLDRIPRASRGMDCF